MCRVVLQLWGSHKVEVCACVQMCSSGKVFGAGHAALGRVACKEEGALKAGSHMCLPSWAEIGTRNLGKSPLHYLFPSSLQSYWVLNILSKESVNGIFLFIFPSLMLHLSSWCLIRFLQNFMHIIVKTYGSIFNIAESKCFILTEKVEIGKGKVYRLSQLYFYCKNKKLKYYHDV